MHPFLASQSTRFTNRAAAGRALAKRLASFDGNCVIAALARGGVPVGYEIAQRLRAPLVVIPVRKLASPIQPEFAVGAIAPAGVIEFNVSAIYGLELEPEQLVDIVDTQRALLEKRTARYAPFQPDISLEGKTAIIVDDGLATGMSMQAAAHFLLKQSPRLVIAAAPVCSRETATQLKLADIETVCLHQPEPFLSVGQWYDEFAQVSDAEVIALLRKANCRMWGTTSPSATS
jgi:putative phosphoribosyl transferase